jgi:hypothetical protein
VLRRKPPLAPVLGEMNLVIILLFFFFVISVLLLSLHIQGVPGVKFTTSGVTSLGDSEPKTSYTHGSNSQRFRSYEVWKKLRKSFGK